MLPVFLRGMRSALVTAASTALSFYTHNPWIMAATPILHMVGKVIRDKHPDGQYDWLPF